MPGSEISDAHATLLKPLLAEAGVVATIVTKHCSVNLHAPLELACERWDDGAQPERETLLGVCGARSDTGEPLAHFHLNWQSLCWAVLISWPLPRIRTEYALLMFSSDPGAVHEDELKQRSELRFYIPATSRCAAQIKSAKGKNTRFRVGPAAA